MVVTRLTCARSACLAQCLFGPLAFGDIHCCPEKFYDVARLVQDEMTDTVAAYRNEVVLF